MTARLQRLPRTETAPTYTAQIPFRNLDQRFCYQTESPFAAKRRLPEDSSRRGMMFSAIFGEAQLFHRHWTQIQDVFAEPIVRRRSDRNDHVEDIERASGRDRFPCLAGADTPSHRSETPNPTILTPGNAAHAAASSVRFRPRLRQGKAVAKMLEANAYVMTSRERMRCQGSQMSVGSPNASNRRLAAAESRKIWAASGLPPAEVGVRKSNGPISERAVAPVPPPKSDSTAAR